MVENLNIPDTDSLINLFTDAIRNKLKAAELKIKKISKDMDGQFTVTESDEA